MSKINYITGDATYPIGDGVKIIMQINNDKNRWGKGFVLALSKRWKEPEAMYRSKSQYILGEVDFVKVEDDIIVANMIAQHDIKWIGNVPPIRYDALKHCLGLVDAVALEYNASVHSPLLGSGLAGGKWNIVEALIEECITVPVTIYILDKKYLPQKGS